MRLNFLWLLSIVFLPFAANLLNTGESDDRVSHGLYLGSMVVTSLTLTVIEWELRRSPELLSSPLGDSWKGPTAAGLLALALVLAMIFPSIGLFWVLLLLLQTPIAAVVRRRR
ncbi:putative membrane protein [Curtobacterium sp. 1544]